MANAPARSIAPRPQRRTIDAARKLPSVPPAASEMLRSEAAVRESPSSSRSSVREAPKA